MLKALLGLYYYKEKSYSLLRTYMVYRFMYNIFIALIVIVFDATTQTYPINYLATIGLLIAFEFILLLIYITSLCRVQVEEALEGIEGFKLTQKNTESKSLLG